MSTEIIERPDVTVEGEIIEHTAPLTLFGTSDPAAVVESATKVATALADVIAQRHLSTRIGGREHIQIEGWTLLGSMLGVFGSIEWTREIERGWEARAVAKTMAGAVVGSAEAMCTRAERTWSNRDEYAIRSMAQTRALSKALRLPLGFIVELAGFAATPLEEMDGIHQPERDSGRSQQPGRRSGQSAETPAPARSAEELALLDELTAIPGMTTAQASLLADAVGVRRGERATADQLRAMIERATQPEAGVPAAPVDSSPSEGTPDSSGTDAATAAAEGTLSPGDPQSQPLSMDDVLAAAGPGAEEVPPRPGTDQFKAMTPQEKANARAWWARQEAPKGARETHEAAEVPA